MLAVVAGSRSHRLSPLGQSALREILTENKSLIVFTGAASGIDTSTKEYVESQGFLTIDFPANWDKYGKAAGPKRNEKMVKYASRDPSAIWVGFYGGSGTANCKRFAAQYGLRLIDLSDKKYVTEILGRQSCMNWNEIWEIYYGMVFVSFLLYVFDHPPEIAIGKAVTWPVLLIIFATRSIKDSLKG